MTATGGRRALGEILLFRGEDGPRTAELAYGVGAEHRGRGAWPRAPSG